MKQLEEQNEELQAALRQSELERVRQEAELQARTLLHLACLSAVPAPLSSRNLRTIDRSDARAVCFLACHMSLLLMQSLFTAGTDPPSAERDTAAGNRIMRQRQRCRCPSADRAAARAAAGRGGGTARAGRRAAAGPAAGSGAAQPTPVVRRRAGAHAVPCSGKPTFALESMSVSRQLCM